MTLEYKKSLSELYIILGYMDIGYLKKIPKKLYNFIEQNKDNSFIPNIDENTPIYEQKLQNQTKILLSLLYRRYWCEKDVKKELIKQDIIQKELLEAERREKYNKDNLFKDTKIKEKVNENCGSNTVQLIEHKKENIFTKIVKLIKVSINKLLKK